MATRMVGGESILLTQAEEDARAAEEVIELAKQATEEIQRKRDRLIEAEKQIALNTIIAPEIAAIESMDSAALDIAIGNL